MVEIHDPADPRLADYVSLVDVRRRDHLERSHGIFVVEGPTAVRRLAGSRYRARSVLVLATRADAMGPVAAALGVPLLVVPAAVMRVVVGFDLHRGVVASADRGAVTELGELLDQVLDTAGTGGRRPGAAFAVLEGINDHENLGAIVRSARALGIDALLLDPRCADPLYRRAVRVSMGEILHLPWAHLPGAPAGIDELRRRGVHVLAMTPRADATPVDEVVLPTATPRAVLLGAEGQGLSGAALAAADQLVRIPIRADVDSLNVGHAAAIAFSRFGAAQTSM